MTIAHCVVAFVFLFSGVLCFIAGCLALVLKGRYWGMIWLMGSVGVISSGIMVYLKVLDILTKRDGGNTLVWVFHDLIQGGFMVVCAMTAIIYMIHWRPPSERH